MLVRPTAADLHPRHQDEENTTVARSFANTHTISWLDDGELSPRQDGGTILRIEKYSTRKDPQCMYTAIEIGSLNRVIHSGRKRSGVFICSRETSPGLRRLRDVEYRVNVFRRERNLRFHARCQHLTRPAAAWSSRNIYPPVPATSRIIGSRLTLETFRDV